MSGKVEGNQLLKRKKKKNITVYNSKINTYNHWLLKDYPNYLFFYGLYSIGYEDKEN